MVKVFIPEIVKRMKPERGKKREAIITAFRQSTSEEVEITCQESTECDTLESENG